MVFLGRSQNEDCLFTLLTACSELKLIHAEGVRIGGFSAVATFFCLGCEDLQKAVLCVHWVAGLSVFGVLLNVKKQTRSLAQDFEVCFLDVGYLFSLYEDGSGSFPVSLHHVSELLKAGLLHF
jgi:hypothetical protein